MSKRNCLLAVIAFIALFSFAAAKPKIRIADGGFPTGQDTPEGVAADFARVFQKMTSPC
jgi:hypothetical protein